MTFFDQFRRENSNISNSLPLKLVNFDTKTKIDHFSRSSIIFSFWTKNSKLTHCGMRNTIAIFHCASTWHLNSWRRLNWATRKADIFPSLSLLLQLVIWHTDHVDQTIMVLQAATHKCCSTTIASFLLKQLYFSVMVLKFTKYPLHEVQSYRTDNRKSGTEKLDTSQFR